MISSFYSKNIALLIFLSFLAISILCLWSVNAMTMGKSSNNCASYGNQMTPCGTDAQSHIFAWQNFLNVIPQKTSDLLLLALLLVLVPATYKNIRPRVPEIVKGLTARSWPTLGIVDPIKRALARGIIQPKIYPSRIG